MVYTYNKLVRDKIPEEINSMKSKNINWEDVKKIQAKKKNKKGSFNRKIYLEYVEEEKRNIKEEEDLKKSIRK